MLTNGLVKPMSHPIDSRSNIREMIASPMPRNHPRVCDFAGSFVLNRAIKTTLSTPRTISINVNPMGYVLQLV